MDSIRRRLCAGSAIGPRLRSAPGESTQIVFEGWCAARDGTARWLHVACTGRERRRGHSRRCDAALQEGLITWWRPQWCRPTATVADLLARRDPRWRAEAPDGGPTFERVRAVTRIVAGTR